MKNLRDKFNEVSVRPVHGKLQNTGERKET